MFRCVGRSLLAGLVVALQATPAALAATAPADPCSLLPAAQIAKAIGRPFGEPEKNVAPRPFPNTAQGTDCYYHAKGGRGTLQFRVYFDPSSSASSDLFKRLQWFFGSGTPAAGIADEAYFDTKHGLHARKANVRFYLAVFGTHTTPAETEKALGSLGAEIAGRL